MEGEQYNKKDEQYDKEYLAKLKETQQELEDYIFNYQAAMDGSVEGFNRCGMHGMNFFENVKELQQMIENHTKEQS